MTPSPEVGNMSKLESECNQSSSFACCDFVTADYANIVESSLRCDVPVAHDPLDPYKYGIVL